MKRLLDFFGSLKLTLGLLLGLALISVVGTIKPTAPGRFELFYQAPWYRLLLGLLALNLAVCTWRTLVRTLGARRRLEQALARQTPSDDATRLPATEADTVRQRLSAAGFHTAMVGDRLLGHRGLAGRWSVPLLHIAILLIMAGAWASQLGFVGTVNIYVTHQTDQYFDWDVEALQPLGFTLRLDHFEPRYYPIDLRFATIDPVTRETLQVYTTREGERVELADGLTVEVTRFFPEEEHLVLTVLRDGVPVGDYHALSGQRQYPNAIRLGIDVRPVAFRDPVLKQLHSQVSILEGGEVVRQGVIEVNKPLVHRGVAIYQTAYSRDESGFWTCGFQLSNDPGEGLVWTSSILLSLALIGVFAIRPRACGLVPVEQGWALVPLTGFRGEGGARQLAQLVERLSQNSEEDSELGKGTPPPSLDAMD